MLPDQIGPDPAPDLMTLNELKLGLGVQTTFSDCDDSLRFALGVVSGLVRLKTGRRLRRADYVDLFHAPSTMDRHHGRPFLSLSEFPVHTLNTLTVDGVEVSAPSALLHRRTGILLPADVSWEAEIEVDYDAGYEPLPYDLQGVITDLVRRQLSSMGVNLANMGAAAPDSAPVKSVSIGALRVEYGVSVTSASVTGTTLGAVTETVLEEYKEVLDHYRHPRMLAAVAA